MGVQTEPSCLECVSKHLGCAWIRLEEASLGYPGKLLTGLSELHEAYRESLAEYQDLAVRIRAVRKNIINSISENCVYSGELWDLIEEVEALWTAQLAL